MKKVLCLVLTAMLLLAASAASAATQLEMLCWMSEQQEGIDAMVDAFNASQKDIEVTVSYMSKSAYFEKLNIGLPAGSAPDIIALNVPSDIDYSKRGFLLDISDLFESGAIDLSRYPEHTIAAHTIDGVLHGVPRDYDSIAVYYNKAIFDAAGEPYPTGDWTWDEFVEVAKRITRADEGIYGTCIASYPNSVVYDMVYSNGGMAFDENGQCVLNNDEAKDALKKISDVILMGSERIHLFDTPLLVAKNMGLPLDQRVMKRILDIVVSGIGIVVASPIMLIVAFCVKLYDRGPVFYFQERLTVGGKPFKICKFRSMCVDSEKHGARLASKHDSRITPVGKVLRNLHLDELPQLFNVFKGDMSLVGPRPERQEIMREYCKEIPEFYYRLKVNAGLTGYAQVYGKYNTTPYDKLKLDLFYVENYSFFLDLKLLLMTVKIFFQKEVSEGVEDDQTNALKDSVEDFSGEDKHELKYRNKR